MNEHVYKAGKILLYVGALGQLALSQIHIGVITKVFDTSIGFFLFLFVITILVTAFNGSSINKESSPGKIMFSIVVFLIAVVIGCLYMYILKTDLETSTILGMKEVLPSIIFTLVTIILCGISLATVIITRKYHE